MWRPVSQTRLSLELVTSHTPLVTAASGRTDLDLAMFMAIIKAMTHTVNIAVLKNGLSELLGKVQSGDSILVCSRNKPVAKITPLPSRPNRSKKGFDPAVKILADLEGPAIPPEDWGILAGSVDAR